MPEAIETKKSTRVSLSGLSLIQKISAGYAAMALFTAAALIFSSYNIYRSTNITRNIANNELPVISALIELRTSLLSQESFAGKYAILKDPAFIDLFHQRQAEALASLDLLGKGKPTGDLQQLNGLYLSYQKAAEDLFAGKTGSTGPMRSSALKLLNAVDASYLKRKDMLKLVLNRADEQQKQTIWWTVAISCTGFLLAIGVAPFVTYRTFGAIRELQSATHRIAAGDFDYNPDVPSGDEISELARDFTKMAARLKVLEQMSLDASPLTRLPGNFAIERVLEDRLQSGATFAFCYADLDNFKPYGDHYGYAKGSEMLRLTGDLIQSAVKAHGGSDGFVGHVGGDDFVMVIPAERVSAVCEAVIEKFSAEVVKHYSPEDLKVGGIEGCDRYGVQRFFPVITISIAVIICGRDQYSSAVEIARAAAKVKDSAKEKPGSKYLIGAPGKVTA
ncbi:HAMP domain-containing protein [Geomonas sp. Red421]|uniref:diguanylate cyclase n=2 Tax=Geomonas anaerohicana TaxID=2798583 RepID=A0ABS0Y959_9BACT|nr:HAMP domain-containing protein [Geomonas anaerohicana]